MSFPLGIVLTQKRNAPERQTDEKSACGDAHANDAHQFLHLITTKTDPLCVWGEQRADLTVNVPFPN